MQTPLRVLGQAQLQRGERRPKQTLWTKVEPQRRAMYVPVTNLGPRECGHYAKVYLSPGRWKCRVCNEVVEDSPGLLQDKKASVTLGNLTLPDYRFFIGAPHPESKFSLCRACRRPLHSVEERRIHLDRFKCSIWLVEAYKVLNLHHTWKGKPGCEDKRLCIGCATETGQAEWGVPMCGKVECKVKWMFSGLVQPALNNALLVVFPELRERLERNKAAWEALHCV
jgi:hypothetical protein